MVMTMLPINWFFIMWQTLWQFFPSPFFPPPNSHQTPRSRYYHHFTEVGTGTERWSDFPKVTQLVKRQRGNLNPRGITVWFRNPFYPCSVPSPIFKVSSPPLGVPHLLLFFLVDFFFFFFPLEEGGGVKSLSREALWGAESGIRVPRVPQAPNQGCCSWGRRTRFLGGWRTHSKYLITTSWLIQSYLRLSASNKELMPT